MTLTHRDRADAMLHDIADLTVRLAAAQVAAEAEMAVVRERHQAAIESLATDLKLAEQDLIKHAVGNRKDIFGDADRVDLTHGSVLIKDERRVKRVRTMLQALKRQGLTYAINKVETVDWDVVKGFDDNLLRLLGTKRVPKPVFSYSLKAESHAKPRRTRRKRVEAGGA